MINKGLMRSFFKRYGFGMFAILMVVLFVILSDDDIVREKIAFPENDMIELQEIYEEKVLPEIEYYEYAHETVELYTGETNMHYAFTKVGLDVWTLKGFNGDIDYSIYEKYQYDLQKIYDKGLLFDSSRDVTSMITQDITSPVFLLMFVMLLYIFNDMRKPAMKQLFGALPVSRKQIIVSLHFFIQTALLTITAIASGVLIIQCQNGGYINREAVMAMFGAYVVNMMMFTALLLLFSMVLDVGNMLAVMVISFILLIFGSTLFVLSLYTMFGLTLPNFQTAWFNFTTVMVNTYSRLSMDISYSRYLLYYIGGIVGCVALSILMCLLAVHVYKQNDMSKGKGIWMFKFKTVTAYIKNAIIGVVLMLCIGTLKIWEDMRIFEAAGVVTYDNSAFAKCPTYVPIDRHIAMGMLLILAGILSGVLYTMYSRKNKGGKDYA